ALGRPLDLVVERNWNVWNSPSAGRLAARAQAIANGEGAATPPHWREPRGTPPRPGARHDRPLLRQGGLRPPPRGIWRAAAAARRAGRGRRGPRPAAALGSGLAPPRSRSVVGAAAAGGAARGRRSAVGPRRRRAACCVADDRRLGCGGAAGARAAAAVDGVRRR